MIITIGVFCRALHYIATTVIKASSAIVRANIVGVGGCDEERLRTAWDTVQGEAKAKILGYFPAVAAWIVEYWGLGVLSIDGYT